MTAVLYRSGGNPRILSTTAQDSVGGIGEDIRRVARPHYPDDTGFEG